MSGLIYSDGKTQALHPQAHAGLSRSWRGHRGVAVSHTPALTPRTLGAEASGLRLRATLVEMSSEEGGGEQVRSRPCLWMSELIRVRGSHAQTQSLFLLLHKNNTAQACRTACTSEASALDYRGPSTTLTRHWKPCLQLADLASTLMATNWKSKNHVRDNNKGFLAFF